MRGWMIGPLIGSVALLQWVGGAPVSHAAIMLAWALLWTFALTGRELVGAVLAVADEIATATDRGRHLEAEDEQALADATAHLTAEEIAREAAKASHPSSRHARSPAELRATIRPVR